MSDRPRHGARVVFPLFLLLGALSSAWAQTAPETVTLAQAIQAALQAGPDAKLAGLSLEVGARAVRPGRGAVRADPRRQRERQLSRTDFGAMIPLADSLGAGLSFSLPQTMTGATLSASYSIAGEPARACRSP